MLLTVRRMSWCVALLIGAYVGFTHDAAHYTANAYINKESVGGTAETATAPRSDNVFHCPMHPNVTSQLPNQVCPECGLPLIKPLRKFPATTQ